MVGLYLIAFRERNPFQYRNLTQQRHELQIGDTSLFILRGTQEAKHGGASMYKELVVAYKTIHDNTYTVIVQDLSGDDQERGILFRHQSEFMWESKITGLVINAHKDFVSFSKDGMRVLSIGETK